jgi:hypothetical protein
MHDSFLPSEVNIFFFCFFITKREVRKGDSNWQLHPLGMVLKRCMSYIQFYLRTIRIFLVNHRPAFKEQLIDMKIYQMALI